MRLAKNSRSIVVAIFFALVVFSIIACIVLRPAFEKEPEKAPTFEYLVLTRDIKEGETIKEEDVVTKEFPMEIQGASKTLAEVVGRTTARDIEHDKPVMPPFLKPLIVLPEAKKEGELQKGYSAVPILINKANLPPYISKGQKYDLYAKSGNFKIENLKILDMLEQPNNNDNELLILEIKTPNVSSLIDKMQNHGGLVFVRRNEYEHGDYKYTAKNEPSLNKAGSSSYTEGVIPALPKTDETISNYLEKEIQKVEQKQEEKQEVEIIIGNQKTKMEFSK